MLFSELSNSSSRKNPKLLIKEPSVTHPPYDRSISFPIEHLKRTNGNSSTWWIGLAHVTNSLAVFHKNWAVRCSPYAPGFSQSSFRNSHSLNSRHAQSSHHKDFSLPAPPSRFMILRTTLNFAAYQLAVTNSMQLVLPHSK